MEGTAFRARHPKNHRPWFRVVHHCGEAAPNVSQLGHGRIIPRDGGDVVLVDVELIGKSFSMKRRRLPTIRGGKNSGKLVSFPPIPTASHAGNRGSTPLGDAMKLPKINFNLQLCNFLQLLTNRRH